MAKNPGPLFLDKFYSIFGEQLISDKTHDELSMVHEPEIEYIPRAQRDDYLNTLKLANAHLQNINQELTNMNRELTRSLQKLAESNSLLAQANFHLVSGNAPRRVKRKPPKSE